VTGPVWRSTPRPPPYHQGDSHVVESTPAAVFGQRFLVEDIQSSPGNGSLLEGGEQGVVVNEAAAGSVDEVGVRLHETELAFTDETLGFRGEAGLDQDKVAFAEHVVQGVHTPHSALVQEFVAGVGVEGENVRVEAGQTFAGDPPYVPESDHADLPAGDFDPGTGEFLAPPAGFYTGVGAGDVAGFREHEPDGELGDSAGVAAKCGHNADAAFGRFLQIDVFKAGAGNGDQFQIGSLADDLTGNGSEVQADRLSIMDCVKEGGRGLNCIRTFKLGDLLQMVLFGFSPLPLDVFDGQISLFKVFSVALGWNVLVADDQGAERLSHSRFRLSL
jgi:hypothetical protein